MNDDVEPPAQRPIRVAVIDDEDLVRRGLAMIVDAQPDMTVVDTAGDGVAALDLLRRRRPDVALLDVQMPRMSGLDVLDEVVRSNLSTAVLVLTTFDLDEYAYAALRAGASGFLLKSASPARLTEAIRAAVAGETTLAPSVIGRLVDQAVRLPPPLADGARPPQLRQLTDRELTVLRIVAEGHSNPEAARLLDVGIATVKTHVNRLLTKLGLRDRVQLVILAYETGLVRAGSRDVQR